MGKKMDALLGRTFKASRVKPTVNLAFSRLSVLKNQRRARIAVARGDTVELLNLGHHERALIRVEQVIKEQNMLDVYVMIEGYFNLLIERLNLLEKEKVCPEELEEVVSSLIYASTRCGEFPELQEMRSIFGSRFGKEFVARATELRNNCGVNSKMVQKLSTRQRSLETRQGVLKEIASENGISLQNEEGSSQMTEGNQPKLDPSMNLGVFKLNNSPTLPEDIEKVEGFSDSTKGKKKYKDVADAAQAAFESAAYAAAAARAAVELSRSDSHDPDDPNSPKLQPKNLFNAHDSKLQNYQSASEDEEIQVVNTTEGSKQKKNAAELDRSLSGSSSDSGDNIVRGAKFSGSRAKTLGRDIVFDGSDDEDDNKQENDSTAHYPSHKTYPLTSQAATKWDSGPANYNTYSGEGPKTKSSLNLNLEKRPVSVRTKRVYGQ